MKQNKKFSIVESYIEKNQGALYRVAYSYVKNQEDALDIVQESILKALASLDSLHNPEFIKTWFYRILVNASLDFLRKSKKLCYVEDEVLAANAADAADSYEDIDLMKAMDALPVSQKSVIVLKYFEDLKLEEIAEIQGENVNTIKTRLYSGLKKLRIELSE